MSQEFYTNFSLSGSDVLLRFVDKDGIRGKRKISGREYQPSLFRKTKKQSPHKTIYGESLEEIKFPSVFKAKQALYKKNETLFGYGRFDYMAVANLYNFETISKDWDINKISVSYLDIETTVDHGFPDINNPSENIYLITLYESLSDTYYVLGLDNDYTPKDKEKYVKFNCEKKLLKTFVLLFNRLAPNVLSGWNIEEFDIPYIISRIRRLFNDNAEAIINKLSIWGEVSSRTFTDVFGEKTIYSIVGCEIMDYMHHYKNIVKAPRPNYKLDTIVNIEIGAEKLKHESGIPGHLLYRDHFSAAVEYNIRDVSLLVDMERETKILELTMMIAYSAMVNYNDVLSQIRTWDNIIFNTLRLKNIHVPTSMPGEEKVKYPGAYVKDPLKGKHDWIVSFDVASMYPNIIRALNIGPETISEHMFQSAVGKSIDDQNALAIKYLHQKVDLSKAKKLDLSVAANGVSFSNQTPSYLAAIVSDVYENRTAYKKKAQNEKQKAKGLTGREKAEALAASHRYDLTQKSLKILLNSLYGAMGNNFFRFYDIRMASAITLTGQVMIQWVAKGLNDFLNKACETDEDYCIMSDTDSVVFDMGKFVEKFCKDENVVDFLDVKSEEIFQKIINRSISSLCDYLNAYNPGALSMKREAIADTGIFVAKKNYIMNLLDDEGYRFPVKNGIGKLKVNGISAIKGTVSPRMKEWFFSMFPVLLHQDEKSMQEKVKEYRNTFKTLSADEIAENKGVNLIEKYSDYDGNPTKGCPAQVKAALAFNRMIKMDGLEMAPIRNGDKIKMIYIKEPNFLKSKVFGWNDEIPQEILNHDLIDYDTLFEKFFEKPLRNITDAMGWETKPVGRIDDIF